MKRVSGNAYLLAKVDNRNLGFAFRIDYAFTPELTVQYYGSPFVSIGKYSNFKEVNHTMSADYTNRFTSLALQQNGVNYSFDDNNDDIADFSNTWHLLHCRAGNGHPYSATRFHP